MDKRIAQLRKQIDEIDEEMIRLLAERIGLVEQLGQLKKELNLSAGDPEREKEIIDRLEKQAAGILSRDQIARIFRSIFHATRKIQE
ncbi:MAG: chorismate mutase [Candidatus Neomarinimicrobiota bacterium]